MEEQWRRRKVRGDEAEQRGEGESPSLQQLLHCLARQEAPAAGGGVLEEACRKALEEGGQEHKLVRRVLAGQLQPPPRAGWYSRDRGRQEAADSGLRVPGTVGVPGKDTVHTALIDTAVGLGNPQDAS